MTIKINGTNTTAQPSITGADTDTGLVYGTDEVQVVTGGTTRATVDSSGRLLVGASSGGANLVVGDVSAPSFNRGAVAIKAVTDGNSLPANIYLEEASGAEGYTLSIDSDGDLNFHNSGAATPTVTFSDDNNVGIGTSSPGLPLDIVSNVSSETVRFRGASGGVGTLRFTSNDAGTNYAFIQSRSTFFDIGSSTSIPLLFSTNGTERLRIDASGSLHIGNTASSAHGSRFLQVGDTSSSAAFIEVRTSTSGDSGVLFSDGTDGTNSGFRGSVEYNHSSDYMFMRTAGTERLRIDASGTSTFSGTNDGVVQLTTTDSRGAFMRFGQAGSYHNMVGCADGITSGDKEDLGVRAADNIIFATGGSTERARIDSSGRLGIGTSSMSSFSTYGNKLVVHGTGTDGPGITISSGTGDTASLFFADGTSGAETHRGSVAYSHGNDSLIFGTSSTTRMTLDSSGRLLVGTSSSVRDDALLQIKDDTGQTAVWMEHNNLANGEYARYIAVDVSTARSGQVGIFKHSGITNPAGFAYLQPVDGADRWYWTDDSDVMRSSALSSHIGTTGGSIIGAQTSDLRLKNVGANVAYGLDEVKQLQPKQYALKDDPDVNKLGFIAQEVESIIPESVYDTGEELDGHQEGDRTKLGMEYVQLIPVLVNAIKELSAEVDTLKTKVAALEAG